jgi:hypothetical protein
MSVLTALDATRICARWSPDDPAAWVMPAPVLARPPRASAPQGEYSWWSLVRNPSAILVSGLVGTMATMDAVHRVVAPVVTRR